jgi:hypothetical protein
MCPGESVIERLFYPCRRSECVHTGGKERPTMTVESGTAEQDQTTGQEAGQAGADQTSETAARTATADEAAKTDIGKSQRAKSKGSARKTRTVELTLSVTGTADGEWQAELKHGSKWVARGLVIPASAVSRAAKELHDELSVPIDEVINAARQQQEAKVAQLEAELEQARQALAELES